MRHGTCESDPAHNNLVVVWQRLFNVAQRFSLCIKTNLKHSRGNRSIDDGIKKPSDGFCRRTTFCHLSTSQARAAGESLRSTAWYRRSDASLFSTESALGHTCTVGAIEHVVCVAGDLAPSPHHHHSLVCCSHERFSFFFPFSVP